MNELRLTLSTIVGTIGAFIANMFGGWDAALITLIIFMSVDYITGLITAGIFKKSKKSQSGGLSSEASWKGLVRKGVMLLLVLVACRLDLLLGSNFIRDAVVIALCTNETISIIENAGLISLTIISIE